MNRRLVIRIYALTAAGAILWLGAVAAAPWLRSRGSGAAGLFYTCFGPVCHQDPGRSFHLWGYPLAVCARCLGVYMGFAGGLILYPFVRGFSSTRLPVLRTLIAASFPIVFDTGANVLGLWDTAGMLRFLTGFLWGLVLPFYFLTGLAELFASRRRETSQNSFKSESAPSPTDSKVTPQ
ncbi:MAG: DUF2085 domain-containing protein [Candidatus Aminicenantes bacterium]|nr:DUF2085 domain-containing protein [Candidatus Aminicenantes bacterium]